MSELTESGAAGLQFAPVIQLSSAPLPFHFGVAALADSAPPSNRVATARPQYFLVRLCFITLFGLGLLDWMNWTGVSGIRVSDSTVCVVFLSCVCGLRFGPL